MKKKNGIVIIIVVSILLVIVGAVLGFLYYQNIQEQEKQRKIEIENKRKEIKSHYGSIVKTTKDTTLLDCSNNNIIGKIGSNVELTLKDISIDEKTKYFITNEFEEEYCLDYHNLQPIEEKTDSNQRYKKYIPFNENIVTKENATFYNDKDEIVYSFNKSFDLPILIKDNDKYYVDYHNQLLYVKKDEVKEVKEVKNIELKVRKNIRTLLYHRINNDDDNSCNQVICLKKSKFIEEMKYLHDNNYLTLTMEELLLFLDNKIRIPQNSIVLTFDDGYYMDNAIKVLEEYNLHATLFVITGRFSDLTQFNSENLELQSHTHNMHNAGECAGYGMQGGGILCLGSQKVTDDLKKTIEIIGSPIAFSYPFYDFDNQSINYVKNVGFKMAFIGQWSTNGLATPKTNKYMIPRNTILSDITFSEFKSLVNY